MKNVLDINEATKLSKQLKSEGKTIILVGGCFDILHPGHVQFLKSAKEKGDVLLVTLESDRKITDLKGSERPLHTQEERAFMLTSLKYVDHGILLPFFSRNEQYDELITRIKPDVIATTENDSHILHKKRQAKRINAKVIEVIKYIPHKSTTRLLKALEKEL